jgi:predicted NACHT family NTPase
LIEKVLSGHTGGDEAKEEAAAKLRAEHKQHLAQKLRSRPGLLGDYRVSLLAEDVVPLDLLPNSAFIGTLRCKEGGKDSSIHQVKMSQVLSAEVCGKGLSVIVGPPGAGKTTLLYHLALRLAETESDEGEVPVIVHAQNLLEKLSAEAKDLEALMGQVAAAVDGSVRSLGYSESLEQIALLAHKAGKSRLTLLVDGLDEVAQASRNKLL